MVEQSRRPNQVVSLQAGPEDVDNNALDFNLRLRDHAARVIGCQLAVIGDQMVQDWTRRQPTWPPIPPNVLEPAQMLTRTIYRDIHRQLWEFQVLFSTLKVWVENTTTGPRVFRTEAVRARVCGLKAFPCTGWTRGALVTVALAAAAASTFWHIVS